MSIRCSLNFLSSHISRRLCLTVGGQLLETICVALTALLHMYRRSFLFSFTMDGYISLHSARLIQGAQLCSLPTRLCPRLCHCTFEFLNGYCFRLCFVIFLPRTVKRFHCQTKLLGFYIVVMCFIVLAFS